MKLAKHIEPEVLRWVCPKCGKEIKSLYFRQLDANRRFHLVKHGIMEPEAEKWMAKTAEKYREFAEKLSAPKKGEEVK